MAIVTGMVTECDRCGNSVKLGQNTDVRPEFVECVVCRSLGARALVPLLKDPTPEALAAFRASPPGSVLFDVGLMRRNLPKYGSWKPFEGDPRHEK
jgi:hypothetical protein